MFSRLLNIGGKFADTTKDVVLGGPIGSLMGALAENAANTVRRRISTADSDPTRNIAFTIGVIALSAKMAKADGCVTPNEVEAFREVFHVPPEDLKNVTRVFDLAKRSVAGYEVYARQLADLFKGRPTVLENLLDGLFYIAMADNFYHPSEDQFLEKVAHIFGFSEIEFAKIKEAHIGAEKSDPWVVLGLSRGATDGEIKAQYRKQVREHHPDMQIAQGMPVEFIEMANKKMAAINAAFDQIREDRLLTPKAPTP